MTKEEKKIQRLEKRKALNTAKDLLRNWIEEVEIDEQEIIDALKLVVGEKKAKVGKRAGYMDIIDLIVEKKTVSENDLWNEFKVGRTDMRNIIKRYVRKSAGQEINWIQFDVEKEEYVLIDTSENVPENWDGPLPKVKEITDNEDIDL